MAHQINGWAMVRCPLNPDNFKVVEGPFEECGDGCYQNVDGAITLPGSIYPTKAEAQAVLRDFLVDAKAKIQIIVDQYQSDIDAINAELGA